jgi:hypothetical protein
MSRTALRRPFTLVSPPPPRIDFGHTFNTSLAPCMIKHCTVHRSQQTARAFCFHILLFPSRGAKASCGYAAPSAFRAPPTLFSTRTVDWFRRRLVMDSGTCQVRDKTTTGSSRRYQGHACKKGDFWRGIDAFFPRTAFAKVDVTVVHAHATDL